LARTRCRSWSRFHEIEQGLVINKTNADVLKLLFGPNPQDAIGGQVELFTDRAMFNGKLVPAIRLRRPNRPYSLPSCGVPSTRPSPTLGEPPDDGAPPHDSVPEGPSEHDLPY
jgi:hypothetical protein